LQKEQTKNLQCGISQVKWFGDINRRTSHMASLSRPMGRYHHEECSEGEAKEAQASDAIPASARFLRNLTSFPFGLSLSKPFSSSRRKDGFDRLSPDGGMAYPNIPPPQG
jgi:hypothetical protein